MGRKPVCGIDSIVNNVLYLVPSGMISQLLNKNLGFVLSGVIKQPCVYVFHANTGKATEFALRLQNSAFRQLLLVV